MMAHRFLTACVVLLSIGYCFTVTFIVPAATTAMTFATSNNSSMKKYELSIIPADWTHIMWSIIYLWLGAAIAYMVTSIFRHNCDRPDRQLEFSTILSLPACMCWCLNLVFFYLWLRVWNTGNVTGSAMFFLFVAFTAWATFALQAYRLGQKGDHLAVESPSDLWAFHALVLNGLALYSTWATGHALVNLTLALRYSRNCHLPDHDSSLVFLGLITALLTFYCLLENFLLDPYVRYVLTPYPATLVFLSGVYDTLRQTQDSTMESLLYVIGLLGAVGVILILRFATVIYRQLRDPLYRGSNNDLHSDMSGAIEMVRPLAAKATTMWKKPPSDAELVPFVIENKIPL